MTVLAHGINFGTENLCWYVYATGFCGVINLLV